MPHEYQIPEPPYGEPVFRQFSAREFGESNGQVMTNPHWDFMVRSGVDPYFVRKFYGCESPLVDTRRKDADWCFVRFGTSRTRLPDGRHLFIAGEHEDFYDPDFCIYNDVIVVTPAEGTDFVSLTQGSVEIRGYPQACFPPTDFHTATLVGEWIYIIGNLGYLESRQANKTSVYRLNTASMKIEEVTTNGEVPGWIHGHHASFDLAANSIVVSGGKRWVGPKQPLEELNASYSFSLATLRWSKLVSGAASRRFVLRHRSQQDPGIEDLSLVCPQRPDFVYRPEGWTGSPYSPSQPCIEVDHVRFDLKELCGELTLRLVGTLPPNRLNEVLEAIRHQLGSITRQAWDCEEVSDHDADVS